MFFSNKQQSDAVVASISARLGVKKSDILDPSAQNLAVRVALAETQLLNETKTFLENVHDVMMTS